MALDLFSERQELIQRRQVRLDELGVGIHGVAGGGGQGGLGLPAAALRGEQAHRTGELAYSTVASSCVIISDVATPGDADLGDDPDCGDRVVTQGVGEDGCWHVPNVLADGGRWRPMAAVRPLPVGTLLHLTPRSAS
jgi:hypothetical protein